MLSIPEAGFIRAQHKSCEDSFLAIVNRKGHTVTTAGHNRDQNEAERYM